MSHASYITLVYISSCMMYVCMYVCRTCSWQLVMYATSSTCLAVLFLAWSFMLSFCGDERKACKILSLECISLVRMSLFKVWSGWSVHSILMVGGRRGVGRL